MGDGPACEGHSHTEAAEQWKLKGNSLFQQKHYHAAEEAYDAAIQLDPTNAVYYSNRAFTHIKLEEYGSAIIDATQAIQLNPTFAKAHYRRGTAYAALGKFRQGLKDFKKCTQLVPNDADAKRKVKECEKEARRIEFEEAIAMDEEKSVVEEIHLESFVVEPDYDGPHLTLPITFEFIKEMIEHFRQMKRLHKKYAYMILLEIRNLFDTFSSVIDVTIPSSNKFTVCGDIHGQFYDLLNIFERNGFPSDENPYLFNGDFVDRGSFSVEVIFTFFALKLFTPHGLHLLRGNHEAKRMNLMFGFQGEVKSKYSEMMFNLFSEVFCRLPLGAVINEKVLVVHGGIPGTDSVTLDDLRKIDRVREPPEEGPMSDILWSDPQKGPGRGPSKRGVGLTFGPDVTHQFLARNNLKLLVRSHEMKDEGYEVEADGKCITVFSAPNYCESKNKAAFIVFGKDLEPHFEQFECVPHPEVKSTPFAGSPFPFFM